MTVDVEYLRRCEDAAQHRATEAKVVQESLRLELESVRRENDELRREVDRLHRLLGSMRSAIVETAAPSIVLGRLASICLAGGDVPSEGNAT